MRFMKRMGAVLWSLAFCLCASAQENTNQAGALPVYPWSEGSGTARVAKELLKELTIPAVSTKNSDPLEFGLTEKFTNVFKLSPAEAQKILKAIAEAHHEYRTVEMQHLEPLGENEEAPQLRSAQQGDEFHFRLKPFPEEAAAIRKKLENGVAAAVGAERAEFFFKNA